jgi:hypothetical protein
MPARQIPTRFHGLIVGLNEAANWLVDQPPLTPKRVQEVNELDDLRALCRKMDKAITWYLGDGKE